MKGLFTLAIFFSATLLFMVQPIVAKILLPVLGGSPAVWSTCLVFFQGVLLLGYVYAHLLTKYVAPRWQRIVHLGMLIAASVLLPMPIDIGEPGAAIPRLWLIRSLAVNVGIPFFALSATAPLLQQWFSRTDDPDAADPYFLYAASNAGSLLGLLGYLLVEPAATRSHQALGWSVAFWAVAALIAACAYSGRVGLPAIARRAKAGGVGMATRNRERGTRTRNRERGTRTRNRERGTANAEPERGTRTRNPNPEPGTRTRNPNPEPGTGTRNRLLWICLALVPSALLLGVTQHLATDVVSVPLLWVMPLALYLATFIACFSAHGFGSSRRWGAVAPWAALLVLVLSLAELRYPILPIALAHLVSFAALAMLCHTRLAESRPDPSHLTEYFLCVSIGGVIGGAAVALVAPQVFSSILEYPLAIAAALLLRPQSAQADRMSKARAVRWAWRASAAVLFVAGYWAVSEFNARAGVETQPLVRASFAIPAVALLLARKSALLFAGITAGLLVGASVVRTGGDVLHRERTFFGVHEVTAQQNGDWHVLTHGTTTHGVQAFRGKVRMLPSAYYHPTGPAGDIVLTLAADGRLRDVAVVGLGAGALAGYAGDGVRMDFFEVDEAVIRIAENPNYFTYLSDARARAGTAVKTIAADGRAGLRHAPPSSYDLIVVDAFSSDAIPTHLITREAVALFMSRLKPRGMLAFHVSNRFFDLAPVLARIADDQGLVCYGRNDQDVPRERAAEGMRPSVWVVLARDERIVGEIARSVPRWVRLNHIGGPLWTDDYTNVLKSLQD